ncbi:MAG: T9SS type A sorting domain-containing protein [Flavobacteriales bacterium]|jgi:hypothetical protein
MTKLLSLLFFATTIVYAQFGPQQIISTDGDGPRAVFAVDIDGDNYKDVLSANKFGYNLTWYKNMGNGTFGAQQIITDLNQPINLYAGDLDGDEDMDVLAVSGPENWVVWYENLDGLGTFGAQQIIADDAILAATVITADLDGDLDLDVISGSDSSGLAWYENLDGLGTFSTKKVINASASNSRSVRAIDIDGDSDLDIVGSTSGSVTVSWYENLDGLGTFGTQQVIAGSAPTVQSLYAADLDGDLDNDVIAATNSENKVSWFENTDGLGSFGAEQIITTLANVVLSVFAADLDNDDDIDILSASASDDKIAWYENTDGQGNFSSQQVITTNADSVRSVFAADLDNDGDMDVLSASQNDDKIAWYENLTILGMEEALNLDIELYPNPANTLLFISNDNNYRINYIKINDVQGKLIKQIQGYNSQIEIEQLEAGVYFVSIYTDKGSIVKKIIKM